MASSPPRTALVWFRQDLRIHDQPALRRAIADGLPVVALYVYEDGILGGASRWWLHHSLVALSQSLSTLNIPLKLCQGPALRAVCETAAALNADRVYWTRQYEPQAIARDTVIKKKLTERGIHAESFNGQLLFEPWTIVKGDGGPYSVFTPFWRALRSAPAPAAPCGAPPRCRAATSTTAGVTLDDLSLLPRKPDWAGGLRETWTPGEKGARQALDRFLDEGLSHYRDARDMPARDAVSRLSPYLHFGEISPGTVWHAIEARAARKPALAASAEKFLSELAWREFAHHLLFHNPKMPEEPLRAQFSRFPWRNDEKGFRAWTKGKTGYPIVDAGMRELWQTGFVHNRVRMIVASFLIKDLLISWQQGAGWFLDTLVDADLASNSMGWQWVAGCGADAAPYFRIFNPVLQGERFDPQGAYVRRFVPELAGLSDDVIHKPFRASADQLAAAGVKLGVTYPEPIVDHGFARDRALRALASLKETS